MVTLRIPIVSDYLERRSLTKRLLSNPNDPDHLFFKSGLFSLVKSGANVTVSTAMMNSVVWRAVTLLSGVIGSLPLHVYERQKPKGKQRDPDHPLYYKLHNRPNPELASNVWRIMGIAFQLLWGNWYNEIEYEGGYPGNLWPLPPWRVKPQRTKTGQLFYEVTLPDQSKKNVPPYAMLHVRNLYITGDEGMSCLQAARESIGLGLSAEEFAARFFGGGANVGGIVEYPGKLSEDARMQFIKTVQEDYVGIGKAHRMMLLEEGLKYHRVGIPPNDGQMIESRKFQVADIGRFFFITQLHKLGDLERATFSNIEHQAIEFVVDTIQPLLINIEQEMGHKLFYDAGSPKHFAEFAIDGLLRGDSKSRAEFYNRLFQVGGLSINDILEKENMNPIGPEGDERFVPMNMVPLKQAVAEEEPTLPFEFDSRRKVETRSGPSRTRIARSYRRIFKDAAARIIKREEADIMRAARQMMGERNRNDFLAFMEEFYKKHSGYVRKQMLPPVAALAEAIQAEVAGEIDVDEGMTPELEKLIDDYVASYTRGHIGSSQGQLKHVMDQALEAGEDEVEALQQRFDEWNERRPDKIASWETVQVNGAITRTVLTLAGITKLVVRNTGAKTCEFCEQLDGVVVGIEQPIIPANSTITGKDSNGNQLKVTGKKLNPPFHPFCQCTIEAVRD